MARPGNRIGLLLLAFLGSARGASLQISPVRVDFQAGANATSLTLRNPGDTPLYGQVRVFLWDQADGADVLTPTQAVVASPPLIRIQPQAEQLIRLVRSPSTPATAEQSYRLLIDEIPADGIQAGSVSFRLRYSIPVFIAPAVAAGTPAPHLTWEVRRDTQGRWQLKVGNTGTLHAQLAVVRLTDHAGRDFTVTTGLLGYALAGRSHTWPLTLPADARLDGPVTLHARVNTQPIDAPVTPVQQ